MQDCPKVVVDIGPNLLALALAIVSAVAASYAAYRAHINGNILRNGVSHVG